MHATLSHEAKVIVFPEVGRQIECVQGISIGTIFATESAKKRVTAAIKRTMQTLGRQSGSGVKRAKRLTRRRKRPLDIS